MEKIPRLKDAVKKIHSQDRLPYEEIIRFWCKAVDIPPPIFEFKFDQERKYQADFAWPIRNLMCEIEGGIFGAPGKGKKCPVCGRKPVYGHTGIGNLISDMEKYNLMAQRRLFLLRFLPSEIKDGSAFRQIKEFFDGGKT
jgi:hypothetical protein